MDRRAEVDAKHEELRELMRARGARALWLHKVRNIAWFSAGIDSTIVLDSEGGSYSILVLDDRRIVVTNNIEITRLRAEDDFGALGFDYAETQWYAPEELRIEGALSDGDPQVEASLQALRVVLMPSEIDRARVLGRDCAEAIEAAARAVQPGDTEWQIAARLVATCRTQGGHAVVSLIATDDRISNFRHPIATSKRVEKLAMLVVCMRRHGLIVSATRFVSLGAAPTELHDKLRKTAHIDAAAMMATVPGRTYGDVFAAMQAAYAAQGEPDQWQNHHQGGLAGYLPRERIATPNDPTLVQASQLFAWNPSIVGAKTEDTILVTGDGFEVITQGAFPMIDVTIDGATVRRPGVLEL